MRRFLAVIFAVLPALTPVLLFLAMTPAPSCRAADAHSCCTHAVTPSASTGGAADHSSSSKADCPSCMACWLYCYGVAIAPASDLAVLKPDSVRFHSASIYGLKRTDQPAVPPPREFGGSVSEVT